MVVIVFRSRFRQGVDPSPLEPVGTRLYEIARQMPGFVSYKDFAAPDGENVSIVEFESLETLEAWRRHPEHVAAQRLGREHYFAEYRIQVCAPVRSYGFPETPESAAGEGGSSAAMSPSSEVAFPSR